MTFGNGFFLQNVLTIFIISIMIINNIMGKLLIFPKKGTFAAAAVLISILISCASSGSVHLVDLTARESPSETELILTTSSPVEYQQTRLDSPPCLIISFPQHKVISSSEEELTINKGPIRTIKNEYFQERKIDRKLLNLMIIELAQDVPCQVSSEGRSIIVKMKNPPSSFAFRSETPTDNERQAQEKASLPEPGYLIGPEDVLSIEVWKHPDISREAVVNAKGEITIPPIKSLSVIGLTASQLEEKLAQALSRYLIDPIVFVTVKQFNSQRVIALGELNTGIYTLKRRTTLVEFLGQIGGMTANADTYHIKLIRKDGEVFIFDFHQLLNAHEKREAIFVSGGDTVYVPPLEMNKIYVLGEVKDPKVVTLKGKMTVVEAVAEAGGYTRDAVLRSIIVIRGEPGAQKGIRVSLKHVLKEADLAQNIDLEPGDIVYVPKSFVADVERFMRTLAFPITWYFWYVR